MNKLNVFFKSLLFIAALATMSCNKDLQDDVADLKDRVTTLEESVEKLQHAIESGKLITSVTPLAATPTTPAGWVVTFSDKTTIPIYNGQDGPTGPAGINGKTPYVWINSNGNWATNLDSKPVDSDNAAYELKVNGKSVKAYGASVRVKNVDGFVGFEEYDAVSGEVKNTVATTIPYDHKNYISLIAETDEVIIMTINEKEYSMVKAGAYPSSITVIRDKDYVIKGGTVEFNIAVNPSTSKVYPKEAFELDYEVDYAVTRGISPDFIKIKNVVPVEGVKGQYTMTLEWAESATEFAKDAAIFIILNFTNGTVDKPVKVMSATPVIMNEKYVSITNANVWDMKDIVMFTDETYTDSVRLSNYHEGYVNTVNYSITPSAIDAPHRGVQDPFNRYNTVGDKYKFTIIPTSVSNTAVWPTDVWKRVVDVKAQVTDYGRAAVPVTPARPDIGQPELPGIPAILPKTIEKPFKVTVIKVPADKIIYTEDLQEFWLPNKSINYKPSRVLNTHIANAGYNLANWDFAIKSQDYTLNGNAVNPANNITADESGFTAIGIYALAYKLEPTMQYGNYTITVNVVATPKKGTRPIELMVAREFKIKFTLVVVPPTFTIELISHDAFQPTADTYNTYKLSNIPISSMLKVESTRNISKATDLTPNQEPLAYEFNVENPRHGAQGVRFSPYPEVVAPAILDWGVLSYIRKPVTINVKLDTDQEIPVQAYCTDNNFVHATGRIYVQYNRLNLHHVNAVTEKFAGNYNSMLGTGIKIGASDNFTPKSVADITLDPTMIAAAPLGIVYSAVGAIQAAPGYVVPDGIVGVQVMSINSATGEVKANDMYTWSNPEIVLFQIFRVTYTDIWGNSASKDVQVYVKSNSVPTI